MQKEQAIVNKDKKTILITGGNGFTGRHACCYFASQGFNVVSVVRRKREENNGVHEEICDLTNAEMISNLIQRIKPSFVLHLAGQSNAGESWENPVLYIQSNVMATLFLLEALRQHASKCKIVVTGSVLQYPMKEESIPPHPYSLSKTMQIFAAKSWASYFDLDLVIAKPTNLIGPGPSTGVCSILAERVAAYEKTGVNEILMNMNLQAERVFLDVRDAVRAYHYLFLEGATGHEYEVAFGTQASIGDIVAVLSTLSTAKFDFLDIGQEEKSPLQPAIKGEEINCISTISLEESLRDTLEYYRFLQSS